MASRVGIELSPAACRIVELDGAVSWQRRTETSVKSFRVLPASGAQTRAALDALGSRAAAIVVWGAAIDHRQVAVE